MRVKRLAAVSEPIFAPRSHVPRAIGHAGDCSYVRPVFEGEWRCHDVAGTAGDEILLIAASRGARNARVFGSMARGYDDARCDIDFLVDLVDGSEQRGSKARRGCQTRCDRHLES